MNKEFLFELFSKVSSGELNADDAYKQASSSLFLEGSDFNIDTTRALRLGFDEVIYGKGKTSDQIVRIGESYIARDLDFICTGLDAEKIEAVKQNLKEIVVLPHAGMCKRQKNEPEKVKGSVAIVTAGTSDAYCAYEASESLNCMGVDNSVHLDVGVAGIHRFFSIAKEASRADVLIVMAGMEGALASVAGGVFSQPVIAVPTSVGYGTAMNGFTALFAMLTSCAPGVTVVNIDNGYGAAAAAFRILTVMKK